MRVEAGAVIDEFDLRGVGQVVARYVRTKAPDGSVRWACTFTVVALGTTDLAVVHRLSASSLAEARRSVRHAVEFLAGRAPATPEPRDQPADRYRTAARRRQADLAPRIPVFDLPADFEVNTPRDPFDRRTPTPLS